MSVVTSCESGAECDFPSVCSGPRIVRLSKCVDIDDLKNALRL